MSEIVYQFREAARVTGKTLAKTMELRQSSERVSQCELHRPRTVRLRRCRTQRRRGNAVAPGAEERMVEEVECFRTELELMLSNDLEVLDRGEVRLEDHGLRAHGTCRAILACLRLRETRRIEDIEACAMEALHGIAGEQCVCWVV